MKRLNNLITTAVTVISMSVQPLNAQNNEASESTAGSESEAGSETDAFAEASVSIGGQRLTMKKAVELVLKNNLTLKSAKYDVLKSDSAFLKSQSKYATRLELEGTYLRQKNPPSGNTFITGDEFLQSEVTASLSKLFSTGTGVSLGMTQKYSDWNDPAVPGIKPTADPGYHEPSLFVSLQQELLKNSFGYSDRLQDSLLRKQASMQREAIISRLSSLVVQALVDYWQVTIEERALENARLELRSATNVRNIIRRNTGLGLAENFDLNQYNAVVAMAEAKVEQKEKSLRDAVRNLLRTVNLPPETEVKGVTDLTDELPDINREEALEAAFEKRVDYRNARLETELAQMQLDLAENNALPSLTASVSVNSRAQNTSIITANSNIPAVNYPTFQAGITMTYPLWDQGVKTEIRDAELSIKQARIDLEDLRIEIRDEVISRYENVILAHKVLNKTRRARVESERYYNRLYARSRRGRFNSVAVKNALDSMINSRHSELRALVDYNIALLQFDLAKNEIFERFSIDIEQLIAEVE